MLSVLGVRFWLPRKRTRLPRRSRIDALRDPENRRRFWRKVSEEENGCWTWTGPAPNGYGQFSIPNGSEDIQVGAHRYAWFLVKGEWPALDDLHHERCTPKNSLCVNPEHLQPVTKAEHKELHRSSTNPQPSTTEENG